MRTKRIVLSLLGLAATASVGAAQARPGSIYDPTRGPIGIIADKTARRPGDLLTVLIQESQDLQNQESSNLKKETTLDYALDSFNLKPSAFSVLPDVKASSTDDFTGTANYQKKGTFTARITAMVMDVLPNGNLVIEGRREIRIDNEVKTIEFSGVVRAYDVAPDNSIESELVADARLSYEGRGDMTDSTNRTGIGRLLHGLISWLWPF